MEKKKLIVYVKEGCPYCHRLVGILNDKGIKFEEVDVYSDDPRADDAVTRGGKKPVPQVEIAGKLIYDYDTEESLVTEIQELMKS